MKLGTVRKSRRDYSTWKMIERSLFFIRRNINSNKSNGEKKADTEREHLQIPFFCSEELHSRIDELLSKTRADLKKYRPQNGPKTEFQRFSDR